MNENEKSARETRESSFDEDQQRMFGNENQPASDATRPPVGTQVDPVLPGIPTPGNEAATPPAKPSNEDEPGDKM